MAASVSTRLWCHRVLLIELNFWDTRGRRLWSVHANNQLMFIKTGQWFWMLGNVVPCCVAVMCYHVCIDYVRRQIFWNGSRLVLTRLHNPQENNFDIYFCSVCFCLCDGHTWGSTVRDWTKWLSKQCQCLFDTSTATHPVGTKAFFASGQTASVR